MLLVDNLIALAAVDEFVKIKTAKRNKKLYLRHIFFRDRLLILGDDF